MEGKELQRVHAIVEGRVQGVGFRYFVRQAANALSVGGWVRNLADGRVELMAEGQKEALEALLRSVREGPRASKVSRIEQNWGDAQGEFEGFAIRATAPRPD